MTDVSLGGAFLAGLVSFLSPCVLPLVPGYISMLSGIGMEQLRRGEAPRSGLFASSLAFVCGFSLVFVWRHGKRGRGLPEAKSRVSDAGCGRIDLAVRVASARPPDQAELSTRDCPRCHSGCTWSDIARAPCATFWGTWRAAFLFALDHRVFWTGACPMAESRCASAERGQPGRPVERISAGFCVCLWLDSVHRPDSDDGAGDGGCRGPRGARRVATGHLLRGAGRSVPAHGSGHWTVPHVLSAVPQISACC